MFSTPIQSHLVEARVDELHRVARTSRRATVPVTATGEAAGAMARVSAFIKRTVVGQSRVAASSQRS